MADLPPQETELVKRLRAEASEVKDCATKYCFQALALSTVVLGAILPLLSKFPLAGFAAVPLVIFLLAAISISFHKFETANRLYGYELHIYRRARLTDSDGNGWKSHMRQIGWEEAFYAWRVVQPFVYRNIYEEKKWYQPVTMKENYSKEKKPLWFRPTVLHTENEAEKNQDNGTEPTEREDAENEPTKNLPAYLAGNYLFILHFLLYLFAICAWIVLVYMSIQLSIELFRHDPWWIQIFDISAFLIALITMAITIVIIGIRIDRMHARRRMLQDELLNINSCAIVWLAVVVAHFRALEALGAQEPDYPLPRYEGYTPELAKLAEELGNNVKTIYDWVHEGANAKRGQPDPQ